MPALWKMKLLQTGRDIVASLSNIEAFDHWQQERFRITCERSRRAFNIGCRVSQFRLEKAERREAKTVNRRGQAVSGEKLSAVSDQLRMKQVPWQLTDQTCEVAWELFELGNSSEFLGVPEFSETRRFRVSCG